MNRGVISEVLRLLAPWLLRRLEARIARRALTRGARRIARADRRRRKWRA